ncbi:NADPH:quinone reductase-like Zn-dependent oxidoreductase [Sphingobium fontiphilum]|uniref:NADPH:quinone reductase-like Zn-dependent oxidoreductase n=1 Tax=Sphingobium fontiphilum TaxID=944425 RepID=A0A7W6GN79_9SPHN|nr:zinc-binding alcohol dehydrogenase family protein [Sphingobium fontiphilum]MBB3982036.1 NADPH:quinone reductase-like Zn-dependent oxidoreductase [Sphingobium fontiphilum]
MRAALIDTTGRLALTEHPEPTAQPGHQVIEVSSAGIGPTDLMRAKGFFGPIGAPYVPGSEGVGRLDNGQRVYFGHSKAPFGAIAERTLVAEEEIWPVPDDLPDDQLIALAISGTGALIPLEEAKIARGESVLILGATGPVGQIGAQIARLLGAGRVVAAARNRERLEAMQAAGHADAIAILGEGDDDAALKAVADGGFDVVLDIIYGPPAEAAMRATRPGARMMSIGVQAGPTVALTLRDLVFRSHVGVGTGQRPAGERRAAYGRLIDMAVTQGLTVDTRRHDFADATQAWAAQAGSPHGKIIISR